MSNPENRYRWKGKIISKKVYLQRTKQGELARQLTRKRKLEESQTSENSENPVDNQEDKKESEELLDGHRIVNLKYLARQLWCISCKETLSLEYVESERRIGLASVLLVRCHKCLIINEVSTGEQKPSVDKRSFRYDINYKSVIGTLHCGSGWTHLQKLFACMDIPSYGFKTFKMYEKEVGLAAEDVAKESCREAAKLEREKTIQQSEALESQLPEEFQSNFIIHRRLSNEDSPPSEPLSSANSQDSFMPEKLNTVENESGASWDDVVRIMVSYDMGWSTRAAGRQYDSKNGFGAIIGGLTGLVLDFSTCNRICATCHRGGSASNHKNCRLNFHGSAKAMEPHVAKKLVVDSEILRGENREVGVLVGDDDSSTIAACRAAANHPIIKQSDVNHTSGGVKKKIYNIQKSHKELTKDRIVYLHRCFTYALAQNKGNSSSLATAIRSIPYHTFNDHSQCGAWCGYHEDEENYVHKVVPGGFEDPILFKELKKIFDKLADNAQKFANGASSNANESLNAMMASKAPKSRCYSRTASADYRFACAVGQKNVGEGYVKKIVQKINLASSEHLTRHISSRQRILLRRRALIRTHEYKKNRMRSKKLRTMLRHQKKNEEGVTYQSNCSLLTQPAVPDKEIEDNDKDSSSEEDTSECVIVLLDLETSGFESDCDILQIAAQCANKKFAIYINPVQQISSKASETHGLTNCSGELFYYGKKLESVPLRLALSNLYEWLKSLEKKCCIATHNLAFDGPRLFRAINKNKLTSDFSEVICGFVDTLKKIREVTGKTKKGSCSISGLADSLNIETAGAHNAIHDCAILHKILKKLNIKNADLFNSATSFLEQIKAWELAVATKKNTDTFSSLDEALSLSIRQKLAKAGITMDILKSKIYPSNPKSVELFLAEKMKTKELQRLQKATIKKIIDCFK